MSDSDISGLTLLGSSVRRPVEHVEAFPAPPTLTRVRFTTEEVTSLCPVTGQPDISGVVIDYQPDRLCVESKSLKLYLWSFRDRPVFAEAMAAEIAAEVRRATRAHAVRVVVTQHARGGIVTEATAEQLGTEATAEQRGTEATAEQRGTEATAEQAGTEPSATA